MNGRARAAPRDLHAAHALRSPPSLAGEIKYQHTLQPGVRPENLGGNAAATRNQTGTWLLALDPTRRAAIMKVARAFGKKRALAMGSQQSQWSSQGATTIALIKERGAAYERKAEAIATKRLELADERVTTVSSLLAMGVEQLKRQLDAFKLLDGRKGAVKPQKGAMLRLLKDWIVDKYGAGAMDCTVEALDKAAEAKAQRRPTTGEPAKKRARKENLSEAEGVVEAILNARAGSKTREYLIAWEPTPLPAGGVQVWPPSWHEYECFVVNGRQPCAEIAELIREMDAVTPADWAARGEHDEAAERLASVIPSVGARVLVEQAADSETWASGTVRALLDGGRATVELDAAGKRKRAQEVEVDGDHLWAAPACAAAPAEVQPGFPVRVQFDDQWCFGVVARVLGASRHVLDITFDNGDKAVVPAFDVFRPDRCEPLVRL